MNPDIFRSVVNNALGILLILLVWELSVRATSVPSYLFPAASEVISYALHNLNGLMKDLTVTASEAIVGLSLAVLISTLTAVLVVRFVSLTGPIEKVSVIVQSVPILAVAPFLTLWFGPGFGSKVAAATLVAVFPLLGGWMTGFNAKARDTELFGEMLFPNSLVRAARFDLPHALPFFTSSLMIAAPLSVLGAIVAEFVGANSGLGFRILTASYYLRTAEMVSAVLFSCGLSLAFLAVIQAFNSATTFWHGGNMTTGRR